MGLCVCLWCVWVCGDVGVGWEGVGGGEGAGGGVVGVWCVDGCQVPGAGFTDTPLANV